MNYLELAQNKLSSKKQKQLIGVSVNEKAADLNSQVNDDDNYQFLLADDQSLESLKILNHSAAHLLAQAVKEIYPQAKISYGPAAEDGSGFFYDFKIPPVNKDSLEEIEKKMKMIVKEEFSIKRLEVSLADLRKIYKDDSLKLEVINNLPLEESYSIYQQGNFNDLCRGPHLPHLGYLKHFKLLSASSVFHSGNKELQRIQGIARFSEKALKKFLQEKEEREKFDHAKIGKELGYYVSSELVGKGLPLFAPKGAKAIQVLERFIEDYEEDYGYVHVKTPAFAEVNLYEVSGHWDLYQENMHILAESGDAYGALRPMSCPFHFQIYKSGKRSYKELPIRYAETATLFRKEKSGAMHGLIRMNQFTLADGHIICKEDQAREEFIKVLEMVQDVLKKIDFKEFYYRFSLSDEKGKYIKNEVIWEKSESMMREILDEMKIPYYEAKGEAAFYGPKLDIQAKNVYGREDTLFTIQLDFALAERFGLSYIDENNEEQVPCIIHRSSIGCYERTLAFLLEQHKGKLPFWYSPEQIRILSISNDYDQYCLNLQKELKEIGVRSVYDQRNESLNKKIKDYRKALVPLAIIIGEKEAMENKVSLRSYHNWQVMGVEKGKFIKIIAGKQKELALFLSENNFL